jgi:hypothetical protein
MGLTMAFSSYATSWPALGGYGRTQQLTLLVGVSRRSAAPGGHALGSSDEAPKWCQSLELDQKTH